MRTHVYIFGSICRGDFDYNSDADLLAITDVFNPLINPNNFSIYSYRRIRELWEEGNPFAWHLHIESKLVFSSDSTNYLKDLGCPSPYGNALYDCGKFQALFKASSEELKHTRINSTFELSCMFLAIRNFASCYSLGICKNPIFSRNSARALCQNPIHIDNKAYDVLERARILCTRGVGDCITDEEIGVVMLNIDNVSNWMATLMKDFNNG